MDDSQLMCQKRNKGRQKTRGEERPEKKVNTRQELN